MSAVAISSATCRPPAPALAPAEGRHEAAEASDRHGSAPFERLPLVSYWGKGMCSTDGKSLAYSDFSSKDSIILDFEVSAPELLACSAGFTAISGSGRLVVSIGGERMLSKTHFLGLVPGPYFFENAYAVDVSEQAAERITGVSFRGPDVVITTGKSEWSFDVRMPEAEWARKEHLKQWHGQ